MTEGLRFGIEWVPPDLQQVVEHPRRKRARNDGYAFISDENGSLIGGFEGSVLNVYRAAKLYLRDCSYASISVIETSVENPNPFPPREPEPEIKIPRYCHVRFLIVA